jgi:hypothetical protein
MDDKIQKCLVVLRRISKAPDGGKLSTINNEIEIYEPTIWNWVWRKALGGTGQRDVKAVKKFYKDIENDMQQWLVNDRVDRYLLHSFKTQLGSSIVGLSKLKTSYNSDANIVSSYENIIEDIIGPLQRKLEQHLGTPEDHKGNAIEPVPRKSKN